MQAAAAAVSTLAPPPTYVERQRAAAQQAQRDGRPYDLLHADPVGSRHKATGRVHLTAFDPFPPFTCLHTDESWRGTGPPARCGPPADPARSRPRHGWRSHPLPPAPMSKGGQALVCGCRVNKTYLPTYPCARSQNLHNQNLLQILLQEPTFALTWMSLPIMASSAIAHSTERTTGG